VVESPAVARRTQRKHDELQSTRLAIQGGKDRQQEEEEGEGKRQRRDGEGRKEKGQMQAATPSLKAAGELWPAPEYSSREGD